MPSFVLHIWLNEGDRAQTALSMMVFGTVSDDGGVRNCSKNGKDIIMVAKIKRL